MKQRLVLPEILDSLASDDPRANRSRRDLGRINTLMGNYRWIAGKMHSADRATPHHWIESGAGAGSLATALFPFPGLVTGLDLAPRPSHWPASWEWRQGDLFETLPTALSDDRPSGFIANLFLHHFDDTGLATLGEILDDSVSRLLFVEPARETLFRVLGYGLFPFVNDVTWHDLQVSIGAGFRHGELATTLALGPSWSIRETVTPLGAYRFEAWKA